MKLFRRALFAFAILVPASWTVARAADTPPPADGAAKKDTTKDSKSTSGTRKTYRDPSPH
jgi:hypothetical protein